MLLKMMSRNLNFKVLTFLLSAVLATLFVALGNSIAQAQITEQIVLTPELEKR